MVSEKKRIFVFLNHVDIQLSSGSSVESQMKNEKEAVYGALNKWVAWELEFPIIAAAKSLLLMMSCVDYSCA